MKLKSNLKNKTLIMKKTLLLFLLLVQVATVYSQTLYDMNTIQDIRIVFAQSNWDALLDAEKAGQMVI